MSHNCTEAVILRCFVKKVFLKNFIEFTENTCASLLEHLFYRTSLVAASDYKKRETDIFQH